MNTDELAIVPVALAQAMFNTDTLFRILVEATSRDAIPAARTQAIEILKQRHEGEEDVTVITQDAVLATFDRVLTALTLAVAGIAAISLAVAGILVMNVMLVSVTQRTAEVGLLKALGAHGTHDPRGVPDRGGAAVGGRRGARLRRGPPRRLRRSASCTRRCRPGRRPGPCSRRWAPRSPPASCSACCRRGAPPRSTRWPRSRDDEAEPSAADQRRDATRTRASAWRCARRRTACAAS